MKRQLVCSNINGAHDALKQVLERCGYDDENDSIIFMGDYIDYHSQPIETLDYLYGLRINNSSNIFLKGEHDEYLLNYLSDGKQDMFWSSNGGEITKSAYNSRIDSRTIERHLAFLDALKPFHMIKNNLFVHSGYTHDRGAGYEHDEEKLYNNDTIWFKALSWENCNKRKEKKDPLPRITALYDRVFTSQVNVLKKYRSLIPMKAANVFTLNTGAEGLGRITILDMDTLGIWQSDNMNEIYRTI